VKIENPAALRFIMENDLYLLPGDKINAQTLVIQPALQPILIEAKDETPVMNYKYKGGNKKQFLVLVNYPSTEFIEDAHLTALENILKRKELSLDDVAIVNLAGYRDQRTTALMNFFKPQRLLVMGQDAAPTDFMLPALNQVAVAENIKTLYSFSFSEMMDSNDNKKAFWEQMKNL
jgi:hypothetical protein